MAPTADQAKAAKAKLLAGGKPPKAKTQRYLKSNEPQLQERGKKSLLLKGMRCSQAMATVLKDMRSMLAPNTKLLSKKNAIVAFETDGQHSLEFLSTKNDCSLFVMASTNKKRPNNLVLGRTFDRQILDMVEVGVVSYKSIHDYGGSVPKKRIGSKPLLLFVGDLWQQDSKCSKLQNLFIDLYRGDVVDKLVLSGLDHLIVFVASYHPEESLQQNHPDQTPSIVVHQRTYFCKLKKNPNDPSSKTPVPYLLNCGPDTTMQIRRTQFASPDLWKTSLKQPQRSALRKKTVKNQTTNVFGETIGRLHISKQNVDQLQGRKSKALRRAEKAKSDEERQAVEDDLQHEKRVLNEEFQQSFGFGQE